MPPYPELMIILHTWPSMDRRRTNQLLRLDRDVIWIRVAVLTDCVMGRHAEIVHSAVGINLQKRRKVLSTFIVNVHLLRGVDIGYLTLHSLSA